MHVKMHVPFVRIRIKVVDSRRIERRRTPFDAVNLVALGKQKLGEIRAVLAGYAGD